MIKLLKEGKTREDLFQELNEKKQIIREVNHRMKNVMQLVKGIISFELFNAHGDEIPVSVLESLSDKIHTIAVFYDELGCSVEGKNVDLADLSRRLINNLVLLYPKEIKTVVDLDSCAVDGKKGVYFSLVMSELIINIIRHNFRDEPDPFLSVSARKSAGMYTVELKNNGNLCGLAGNNKEGLGTSLIDFFLETVSGRISTEIDGRFLVARIEMEV